MKRIVMSNQYPQFCKELENRGYEIIPSDTVTAFPKPERKHADMQLLPINDRIFILKECSILKDKLSGFHLVETENQAGQSYPANILLNFLYLNRKLYGRISSLDNSVKEYCENTNIELVNVNQGYARCSTLVINNNSVITADKSIEKALVENGVEVLLINPGNIRLEGYDYGFIGGCSGVTDNTVYFFGDLDSHPESDKITRFITGKGYKTEPLCTELPLTDIGGIITL